MIRIARASVGPQALWRWAVAISFAAAIARSGSAQASLPRYVWYVLQFGPLAVASLHLLIRPLVRLRRVEAGILVCLGLYTLCALVTTLTGLFPRQTLEQSGVLLFMFLFLGLTMSRRWTTSEVLLTDLIIVVSLVSAAQLVGLAGTALRQSWAIGDYGRFKGLFSNANYAGIVSATGIILSVYIIGVAKNQWRRLTVGGAVLQVLALILSESRGALVGLAIGTLVLLVPRAAKHTAFRVALIVLALVTVATVAMPSLLPRFSGSFNRPVPTADITSGRVLIYSEELARWSRMPWFGTGYRTTELLTGGRAAHDVYLSVLSETGVVGLAVFGALVALILAAGPRSGTERLLLGAAVTVLAIELTESTLFGWGSPTTVVSWLALMAFAASGRAVNPGVNTDLEQQTSTGGLPVLEE